jgi:maltose alpha-D-glucosyltransferase/alpha-amylase
VDPVVELGRYLTEEAGFTGVPALAGHIDYEMQGESACPVALLERFVPNQGSLWVRTRELLQRLVDEQAHVGGRERGDGADRAQYDLARLDFEALIDRLGRRVGELHRALAAGGAGPASDLRPEPVPGDAPDRWRADAVAAAERALERLRGASDDLPDAARGAAERLLARADDLAAAFSDWSGGGLGPARQRIHGDLHLQRVLVAEDDVVLVNAGGPAHMEPAPRRRKRFPEEDLGRLVASLHAAVLDVQQATRDEHPAADQRLSEWLTDWCWSTVERLVHAYAAAVTGLAAAPRPDEPGPDGRIRRLTRLFALRDAVDALDASIPCSPERRAQAIALVLRLLPAAEGAPPTRE